MRRTDGKLHFSDLKHMARSAQHYRSALDEPREPSAAMEFGTLVHRLILGGDDFAVFPGKVRNGKAWETFEADVHASHPDRLIVTTDVAGRAAVAAKRILENLRWITELETGITGYQLVTEGLKEHAIDWTYRGRPAHSTLDVLGPGRIVDLKLTTNASPGKAKWHGQAMLYHAQMAFYQQAASHGVDRMLCSTGRQPFVVFAEVAPPHACSVLRCMPRLLEEGARCCAAWFEQLVVCEQAKAWPGYSQTFIDWDFEDEPDVEYEGDEA